VGWREATGAAAFRWGGDILRGGPAARGRGEKGDPGKVERRVEGLEEGGGAAPTGGGQLGRRGTTGSGPAAAPACGARVRTMVGGAGSLTSRPVWQWEGAGRERRGRVWAGRGRKWSVPSPYEL
jgi:hypothetical protein